MSSDYLVYFIGAVDNRTGTLESVKIGYTTDLNERCDSLATGNHCELVVLKTIECNNRETAIRMEKRLHSRFSQYNLSGEWFSISKMLLMEIFS